MDNTTYNALLHNFEKSSLVCNKCTVQKSVVRACVCARYTAFIWQECSSSATSGNQF